MASLKIKYRHSSIEGKAGTLFYQVIHNRVARQINSGYKIYPDEWDIFNSQIIIPAKTGENRHRYLVSLKKCIEEDTSRLKDIMIRFENLGYKYTADEIIEYYSAPPVNEYFVSFCENLIEELRQIGKIRTTETYTTTLNSFKRFMNFRKKGRDIPFDNIDSNLMMEYEQYLKSNDICPNSTSYAELQKALFFCQRKKIPLLFVSLKGMIDDIRFLNLLEESHVDFRCIDFPWFCKENLPLIKAVVLYEKLEIRINV